MDIVIMGEEKRKVYAHRMNFKGIEKKEAGKFITRYDITYETVDNQKKVYEIISRKKDMETYEALHGDKPDAVVIIATNEISCLSTRNFDWL